MPDITMCTSQTCERREQCYRAIVKPDKIQSYADFTSLCADREVLADDISCLLVRC